MSRFNLSISALALALFATACEQPLDSEETESPPIDAPAGAILTLGDSIFDFHEVEGQDIPEVIGESLGRAVVDRAQGGAQFAPVEPDDEGFDIRGQYVEGDWSWVVLDGGGNDVNDQCGCGDCDEVLDRLISEDGRSGEVADFARRVTETGAQLLFVGYYPIPEGAAFGFDRCGDELVEHEARLQRMAEAIDGAYFISAGDVVSADELSMYDGDRVHPSVEGSRVVGEYIAETILELEGR